MTKDYSATENQSNFLFFFLIFLFQVFAILSLFTLVKYLVINCTQLLFLDSLKFHF